MKGQQTYTIAPHAAWAGNDNDRNVMSDPYVWHKKDGDWTSDVPENDVVKAALRAGREEPEDELRMPEFV